jgi:hypothetical protein
MHPRLASQQIPHSIFGKVACATALAISLAHSFLPAPRGGRAVLGFYYYGVKAVTSVLQPSISFFSRHHPWTIYRTKVPTPLRTRLYAILNRTRESYSF